MTKNYNNSNSKIASHIIRDGGGVTSDPIPPFYRYSIDKTESLGWVRFAHTAPYRKCGFTLAEVLITLAIVGVVAALTIPNLIVEHQKKETVTRLKKVYSTISQAKVRAEVDYGDFSTWEFPLVLNDEDQNAKFFNKYFAPYIQVKDCKSSESACQSKSSLLRQIANLGYTLHVLDNGTQVSMSPSPDGYVYIVVDINGGGKPDTSGRDVFHMNIYPNTGTTFFGGSARTKRTREEIKNGVFVNNNTATSNCSRETNASFPMYNCGALIQLDGWQISDDYPW